jgi:hypothetical protein
MENRSGTIHSLRSKLNEGAVTPANELRFRLLFVLFKGRRHQPMTVASHGRANHRPTPHPVCG